MVKQLSVYKKKIKIKVLGIYRSVAPQKKGINLIGYFSYTFGVAEIGRFFAKRMIGAKVPFAIYDIESQVHALLDKDSLHPFTIYFTKKPPYHKNIFFVNGDTIHDIEFRHPRLFAGRYNAAVFFWEFDDYFHFPKAFIFLDEVIAFTGFIATAIRKVAPPHVKVTHLPIPFVQSWQITATREDVRGGRGIANDEFVFIFNFDFYSVYNRKNPEAIVRAFETAFTEKDGVRLILKTLHAEKMSDHYQRFTTLVEGTGMKDKIIMINENMERNEFMSLLHASDCYVSLHRSEGLGLGMMEAVSMGKPVIATRYGGNTDFMNDENSLLLSYTLVPVEPGSEPYQPGWLWADADVPQAAAYMKQLYENRSFAKDLGTKAQQYINDQYNQETFTQVLDGWMKAGRHQLNLKERSLQRPPC